MLKQFSKEVRSAIQAEVAKATSIDAQQRLLFQWHRSGLKARDAVGGGVSREELMRFFNEELNEEQREELAQNNTSPDQFRRELQRKYFFEKELPPGGPWQRWGQRGRGEGGHGRGDGRPRFEGDRHRKGPDGHGRDNGDDRRPRDRARERPDD